MNERSISNLTALGFTGLLLCASPGAATEASAHSSLEAPVLRCFEQYAKRYSATNALPADIASAAYAHCYNTLLDFTQQLRTESSSSLTTALNTDERIASDRLELEKRAHATALDQILRSRYKQH